MMVTRCTFYMVFLNSYLNKHSELFYWSWFGTRCCSCQLKVMTAAQWCNLNDNSNPNWQCTRCLTASLSCKDQFFWVISRKAKFYRSRWRKIKVQSFCCNYKLPSLKFICQLLIIIFLAYWYSFSTSLTLMTLTLTLCFEDKLISHCWHQETNNKH